MDRALAALDFRSVQVHAVQLSILDAADDSRYL